MAIDEEETGEGWGNMWDLDQKLDQPMDEEAGRLNNMDRDKVGLLLPCYYYPSILPIFYFHSTEDLGRIAAEAILSESWDRVW